MDSDLLSVSAELAIPVAELSFRATRAGGPGGQHVNRAATRVELTWNLGASASLTEAQRARIREKLASRIQADGSIRVVASTSRSQHRNRQAAMERLAELVRGALAVQPPRRKTRPPAGARERRLRSKKRRSETKRLRRPPPSE